MTGISDTLGHADGLSLALSRELQTGERVLWQGRPLKRVDLLSFSLYLFAIPWTAFALFWTAMAFAGVNGSDDSDLSWFAYAFPLFGLPFIGVGIGMLVSPFLPLFTANKTLFAVTDRRLIKLTLGRTLSSDTVPASRIGLIRRKERPDGSGILSIATRVGTDSDGNRTTESFLIGHVENVMQVERRIEDMTRHAASRRVSP